ncbi:hypothetical protein ACEWJZ_14425, partial [Escherichia coli]
MPYKTKSDLPESVKHVLPSHAQDIYGRCEQVP